MGMSGFILPFCPDSIKCIRKYIISHFSVNIFQYKHLFIEYSKKKYNYFRLIERSGELSSVCVLRKHFRGALLICLI